LAEIIPALNKATLGRMTVGEKRLARSLKVLLDENCLCWYDIPVGKKRRYPDFIILHPGRGLLFLEVKDWKPETLKAINKTEVTLLTTNGLKPKAHPLEQARQCTYPVINQLSRDPELQQKHGKHAGEFLQPYGQGVVFTHISRRQIEKALSDKQREMLLPDRLVIYKDEFGEHIDAEQFQQRLWGMFNYRFGNELSPSQIDRIRWHLFPEVRIGAKQFSLLDEDPSEHTDSVSDTIRIMDLQQEKLARSLGAGHRVIHGVAGSGKTLILGYRCQKLAHTSSKPILVLCFNISLAARLRAFISAKGVGDKAEVHHFHGWCAEQLKTYRIDNAESREKNHNAIVKSVIAAVDEGQIPRARYGALLIDEGHDFEAQWLQLVVQMIDPESSSLLLMYDDAQSIYRKNRGLGFSLKSVGIHAQGRTTVLKKNYRNTREILHFAYEFARHHIHATKPADEDIPLIEPEAAGGHGDVPTVYQANNFNGEIRHAVSVLRKWQKQGIAWADMTVLYRRRWQSENMVAQLDKMAIPYLWMDNKSNKKAYDPAANEVTVVTMHSSKGLEFSHVIIIGTGSLSDKKEEIQDEASG